MMSKEDLLSEFQFWARLEPSVFEGEVGDKVTIVLGDLKERRFVIDLDTAYPPYSAWYEVLLICAMRRNRLEADLTEDGLWEFKVISKADDLDCTMGVAGLPVHALFSAYTGRLAAEREVASYE